MGHVRLSAISSFCSFFFPHTKYTIVSRLQVQEYPFWRKIMITKQYLKTERSPFSLVSFMPVSILSILIICSFLSILELLWPDSLGDSPRMLTPLADSMVASVSTWSSSLLCFCQILAIFQKLFTQKITSSTDDRAEMRAIRTRRENESSKKSSVQQTGSFFGDLFCRFVEK